MSEAKVTRQDGPTRGRYVARVDGIDAGGSSPIAALAQS